ncbi:MAG: hypothetical protein PHW52_05525 [Candidatus Pacebacteria bacterium]|nr:hypothetical protein [Candidatus Paceibacterota bacterium]
MNLKVTLQGELLKKMPKAAIFAQESIKKAVKDASTQLMEDVITSAPYGIGDLRKSIRRTFSENGLSASIFPTVQYAYDLHGEDKARGERSAPFTIPAEEAKEGGSLYRWAKKKGLNPWAVRGVIKKKGRMYQPWIREVAEKDEKIVGDIIGEALDRITNHLKD